MNLIEDVWIPATRAKGGTSLIAPWQITEPGDPVMKIAAPRPDFQGAIYLFLIGLLQTAFAPEDQDEWLDLWENPPDPEVLRRRLEVLVPAFELDSSTGPAFLQDLALSEGERKGIGALLIESPGDNTIRDNRDHFVKRDRIKSMCKSCSAIALFTLQANAPSGGAGNRVGLRGGGPLTTLVMPLQETFLWQTLWLNVLDRESVPGYPQEQQAMVFPWMAHTRVSGKGGRNTTPDDAHPLQAYWGMPRRIRIRFAEAATGHCDICGADNVEVVENYDARNLGVNYTGGWVHPLTPYRFDRKKETPPLSLKGMKGGLVYRHWLGLTLTDVEDGSRAADVVKRYTENRGRQIGSSRTARLWCFGFDMDNMKARCWYDQTFPLFGLEPAQRRNLLRWAEQLVTPATDVSGVVRRQVKAAWFRSPEESKCGMNAVAIDFWQRSEPVFFELIDRLFSSLGDREKPPPDVFAAWRTELLILSMQLFDNWVLSGSVEDLDMKRVIAEREKMTGIIRGLKSMKVLLANSTAEEGEEAMGQKYRFLDDQKTRDSLLSWWKWLEENRSERARLRRVERPDDALMTGAFSRFIHHMPQEWSGPQRLTGAAMVAAILAHVDIHNNTEAMTFAVQLATPKKWGDKPPMSELRFQQLQKCNDPDEFYRRMVRTLRVLDRNVNILSLANDILHWMYEYYRGVDRNPTSRLAFCWASNYYKTLLKIESKFPKEEMPNEPLRTDPHADVLSPRQPEP